MYTHAERADTLLLFLLYSFLLYDYTTEYIFKKKQKKTNIFLLEMKQG
jgi:hypothetical protein